MRDQVGRVRLASQRHRGEIGRVGLDEHPIQRGHGQCGAQLIIGLERDCARKGEVRAAVQAGSGELIIAGEAVHHDAIRRTLGIEHIKNVVVGIAIMDDEGLVERLGEGDVRRKCLPLYGLTGQHRSF